MLKAAETDPQPSRKMGPMGLFLAASGATLLAFTMAATTVVAVLWAIVKLTGLPDVVLYGLLVLGLAPIIWATIWTAGRAWHVEQRLERGQDVDSPVFKMLHYFRKS
jgi:hypothetical protein